MIELLDGNGNGGVELLDGAEGLVREKVAFEVTPRAFNVVQCRATIMIAA